MSNTVIAKRSHLEVLSPTRQKCRWAIIFDFPFTRNLIGMYCFTLFSSFVSLFSCPLVTLSYREFSFPVFLVPFQWSSLILEMPDQTRCEAILCRHWSGVSGILPSAQNIRSRGPTLDQGPLVPQEEKSNSRFHLLSGASNRKKWTSLQWYISQ